jgi:hypothetical protein
MSRRPVKEPRTRTREADISHGRDSTHMKVNRPSFSLPPQFITISVASLFSSHLDLPYLSTLSEYSSHWLQCEDNKNKVSKSSCGLLNEDLQCVCENTQDDSVQKRKG